MQGNDGTKVSYHVIGVVKDFHFRSLHEAITPLLMVLKPEWGLIVKTKTAGVAGLLSSMKQRWQKLQWLYPPVESGPRFDSGPCARSRPVGVWAYLRHQHRR